jgi:hypothetical protein
MKWAATPSYKILFESYTNQVAASPVRIANCDSVVLCRVISILRYIGLSVPHRKHITSPLRTQQVNAIYRFVTMVY